MQNIPNQLCSGIVLWDRARRTASAAAMDSVVKAPTGGTISSRLPRSPNRALGLRRVAPVGDASDNTTIEYVDSRLKRTWWSDRDSIIAIHGLETESPRTWEFRKKGTVVNWLSDTDMLPQAIPEAKIFTYDWDANSFGDAPVKTLLGHADTFLALVAESRSSETRPIIFVASCFGGLIWLRYVLITGPCRMVPCEED